MYIYSIKNGDKYETYGNRELLELRVNYDSENN